MPFQSMLSHLVRRPIPGIALKQADDRSRRLLLTWPLARSHRIVAINRRRVRREHEDSEGSRFSACALFAPFMLPSKETSRWMRGFVVPGATDGFRAFRFWHFQADVGLTSASSVEPECPTYASLRPSICAAGNR